MSPGNKRLLVALGALVAASRWLARGSAPDDYDAFGFVLGIGERFDLALFQPQFPGYPVFIALGRALTLLGLSGLSAATLVSACASGIAGVSLALCAQRLAGTRAAFATLALHGLAWGPLFLGSSALSESLGMALVAGAFAALLFEHAALSGALAGLLLGARASYFPLLIPLVVLVLLRAQSPRRFFIALFAASLAWAIPFAMVVGPRTLVALGHVHLTGHFAQWGGSIATRPDLRERITAFSRGLVLDGLAPSLLALLAFALCLLATLLLRRERIASRPLLALLAVLAPYAVWVFVGQNIVEQPRHLLPLVEGLLLCTACVLSQQPLALCVAALSLAAVNVPLALERRRVLPAAAQAARWVAQQEDAANTLCAAGRSARFFRAYAQPAQVQEHVGLGDLSASLARMDALPPRVLATSEIDLSSARAPWRWRTIAGPTFCRDARIDRARPCLSLSQLVWSPR